MALEWIGAWLGRMLAPTHATARAAESMEAAVAKDQPAVPASLLKQVFARLLADGVVERPVLLDHVRVAWKHVVVMRGATTVGGAILKLAMDAHNPIFKDWTPDKTVVLSSTAKYHVPAVAVTSAQLILEDTMSLDDMKALVQEYVEGKLQLVAGYNSTFIYTVGTVAVPKGTYHNTDKMAMGCGAGIHVYFSEEAAIGYRCGGNHVLSPPLLQPGAQVPWLDALLRGEAAGPTEAAVLTPRTTHMGGTVELVGSGGGGEEDDDKEDDVRAAEAETLLRQRHRFVGTES